MGRVVHRGQLSPQELGCSLRSWWHRGGSLVLHALPVIPNTLVLHPGRSIATLSGACRAIHSGWPSLPPQWFPPGGPCLFTRVMHLGELAKCLALLLDWGRGGIPADAALGRVQQGCYRGSGLMQPGGRSKGVVGGPTSSTLCVASRWECSCYPLAIPFYPARGPPSPGRPLGEGKMLGRRSPLYTVQLEWVRYSVLHVGMLEEQRTQNLGSCSL